MLNQVIDEYLRAIRTGKMSEVRERQKQIGSYPTNAITAACEAGRKKVVSFLLEKGAVCVDPTSAVDMAARKNNAKIVKLLVDKGYKNSNAAFWAARNKNVAILAMVGLPADPTEILHDAIIFGNDEVVQWITDRTTPSQETMHLANALGRPLHCSAKLDERIVCMNDYSLDAQDAWMDTIRIE